MKTKSLVKITMLALGGFFLSNTQAAVSESTQDADAHAKGETIYVEYRENFTEIHPRPYNSMFNELDRFHYFKRNFEKAFEKEKWPVTFKFERFPLKAPEGAKVLEMTFLGLRSLGPVEWEMRMWAILNDGSKKHDFGVHLVREAPLAFATSASIERDLDKLYTKVAENVIKDLNNTIFASE